MPSYLARLNSHFNINKRATSSMRYARLLFSRRFRFADTLRVLLLLLFARDAVVRHDSSGISKKMAKREREEDTRRCAPSTATTRCLRATFTENLYHENKSRDYYSRAKITRAMKLSECGVMRTYIRI